MRVLTTLILGLLIGAAGVFFFLPTPCPLPPAAIEPACPPPSVATAPPAASEPPGPHAAPIDRMDEPAPTPNAQAAAAVAAIKPSEPIAPEPIAPPIAPPAPLPPVAPVPFELQAERLLIPVEGVEASALTDTFSQARGSGRSHDAIDIVAPRGTRVLAVADGRVAKLFTSKPGGLTVYQFDPGERFAYYYAHLDGYARGLVEGQWLKRGDLVGYVGSTGNANPDAPHLHFAIFALGPEKRWWEGTAINPYPLLAHAE